MEKSVMQTTLRFISDERGSSRFVSLFSLFETNVKIWFYLIWCWKGNNLMLTRLTPVATLT